MLWWWEKQECAPWPGRMKQAQRFCPDNGGMEQSVEDRALSIIWQCGERSVRVVVPESLLMKGETLLCAEDSEQDSRKQASAGTDPTLVAFDEQPLSGSTSAHGVSHALRSGTPLGNIVSKYIPEFCTSQLFF